MLHLLSLEWKKLSANKTFVIITAIYLISLPLIFLIGKFIPDFFGSSSDIKGGNPLSLLALTEDPYIFPNVWKSLSYLGGWFNYYFLGFISIFIITNEIEFKTLKQGVINGLTRKDFFIAKILIVVAIGLFFSMYYILLGLLIGVFSTEYIVMSKVLQNTHIIPQYALQILGYMTLAASMAWVFKRFALTFVLFIFYPILEFVVINLLLFYKVHYIWVMYLPVNAFKNLVPFYTPFPFINTTYIKLADDYLEKNGIPFFLQESDAIVASILFVMLFMFASYRLFRKADL